MGLKPYMSFSTGELDPILHDAVTLEKFNKGLATARNIIIGKTGSIMSRFSTQNIIKAKNDNEKIKILSIPISASSYILVVIEWGIGYVRVYNVYPGIFTTPVILRATVVTTYTEDNLDSMHFVVTGDFIYVFVSGVASAKFNYKTYAFISNFFVLATTQSKLSTFTITATGSPSGYQVDYAIALVYNGEELIHLPSTGTYYAPSAAGESNTIAVNFGAVVADIAKFTELRVYRRPSAGAAFGFLGSTNNFAASGTDLICSFIDLGGDADFTNGIMDTVTKSGLNGVSLQSLTYKTGVIYQQRLLLAPTSYSDVILASRPGYIDNFYRDFPYDADSALNFKTGISGAASVLRMIDNDGLIVFASNGIYVNLGVLSIDNLVLVKKGNWIISDSVPPLSVPGGVFFVDVSTNNIMQFIYSDEIGTYQSLEHSIFSNHLFADKLITSWAFQSGTSPLIIVTFSDGTFATFTYNFEHQMRAWTRHDSKYLVEQVEETTLADRSLLVINKNGNRYIDITLPRRIVVDKNQYQNHYKEIDKSPQEFLMDSCKCFRSLMNDLLDPADEFELDPVTPDDWEGNLTLTDGTSGALTIGVAPVGGILRFFDENDRSVVDLTVVSRTSDDEIVVKPSCEFPSDQATGFNLYRTFVSLTGLEHLEGEEVAIVSDGCVVASPNNTVENYTVYTVASGAITLEEQHRGAIINVGRPVVADTKTLNINTLEQKPTTLESLTINKLYIRVHKTRGLYVAGSFPEEKDGEVDGSSIEGMEDLDLFYVPDGHDIIANRYKQPVSARIEKTIPGNWKSNGQIALRQVDPLHFEILSIIPDAEVLWRSDR